MGTRNTPVRSDAPAIALVGRPNVGKSTLFNRLTHSRDALVANVPGLTRDRRYGAFLLDDRAVTVIDTGGLEGQESGIEAEMARQSRLAIAEAAVVVLMLDARAGVTAADEALAEELRRGGACVLLVANKADGVDLRPLEAEVWRLGLGAALPISASHGRGLGAFADALQALLPPVPGGHGAGANAADDDDARSGDDDGTTVATGVPDPRAPAAGLPDAGTDALADALDDVPDDARDAAAAGSAGEGRPGGAAPGAPIRVAIIGRPNVGKSTLINRMLGEERLVTFDAPGTTRDSIDVTLDRDGARWMLVDTAGIRRRGRIDDVIEKFSVAKALEAVRRAQIVAMVIDAREGLVDQDLHLLGNALDEGRAAVLVVNKWDGLSADERQAVRVELDRRLDFVAWMPVRFISALHGTGVGELFDELKAVHRASSQQTQTHQLSRILEKAVTEHPPPMVGGRNIKLRYAHPGGMHPPTVVIHGNRVDALPEHYKRYLENRFRDGLELAGTPVRLQFRSSVNPFAGRKNVLTPRQQRQRQRLMRHVKSRKR